MKENEYNDDWFVSITVSLLLVAAAVGNYFYHGGQFVW